jgi:CheY-like chemotaxis protein
MSTPNVLTLLVVDDDRANLELITEVLEQEGLEILTTEDTEVGLEMFLRVRPRLVLVDLIMPKMNGLELLERILAVDPGIDVIFSKPSFLHHGLKVAVSGSDYPHVYLARGKRSDPLHSMILHNP